MMSFLSSFFRSVSHACRGFSYAWRAEQNIRIHIVAAGVISVLGYVCGLNRVEWALVFFAIGFVLFAELCNSALEALIDMAIPRVSPGVKHIKDMVAAGVLVSAFTALCIAGAVFTPHLFILFR